MEIIKVYIEDLKEYDNNAKKHPENQIEQIKKSIEEFGFNDPIAIDQDNVIIEGHGRLYALKELGYKDIECIRLTHLTEEQKRAYILAHNKLTMNTGFDFQKLDLELEKITTLDMSLFGFSAIEDEVDDELDSYDQEDSALCREKAKRGDMYLLDDHLLLCDNGQDKKVVSKAIYNENMVNRKSFTIENDPKMVDKIIAIFEEKTGHKVTKIITASALEKGDE